MVILLIILLLLLIGVTSYIIYSYEKQIESYRESIRDLDNCYIYITKVYIRGNKELNELKSKSDKPDAEIFRYLMQHLIKLRTISFKLSRILEDLRKI